MPPKRRDPDSNTPTQTKRRKKKKDEFDEESDEEIENNGHDAASFYEEPENTIDITLGGSMLMGEVLISGGTNWDLIGRNQVPKGMKNKGGPNLWRPHRISTVTGQKIRTVVSNCTACHSVLITAEGKALTFGRNDKGQLGLGHCERIDPPTVVESLSEFNIVEAACGRNHTLFLTDKGHVYACGDNKHGQLGIGSQSIPNINTPQRINYKGPPIRKLACGAEFSMICDIRGNLYSFGCPEYGQLGHNTDGKYFVTSNKLAYKCELNPRKVNVWIEKARDGRITPILDVEVRDVACGVNHTSILDSKKRIFSWGFGGYGRLGHAEPKDEMVPRLLKFFDGPNRGATMIAAGSAFTFAVNEYGALYLWGQTKATGEAAMYPKLVQDLSGWRVRSIGCCFPDDNVCESYAKAYINDMDKVMHSNRSIVIAADESLVSWGPSPTYGELGYGEHKQKSSTTAQEVKTLEGAYIHAVSCGYGHALLIARNDTDAEKEAISKLPLYTPGS